MEATGFRQAAFVGLSIGGIIAQGLAAERPDLVRIAVLSNTAAKIGTEDSWRARMAAVRAGGIEAGMSTGELLRVSAAMKPIATVPRALPTVDVATGAETTAHHQRSDVAAVPAAGIVAEAMVALVLADAMLEKFGGDSVGETRRNMAAFQAAVPALPEPSADADASGHMGDPLQ